MFNRDAAPYEGFGIKGSRRRPVREGGADNDEEYTFSLFHYAVAGIEMRF